ncbi:MAG: DUF899 domain-containing protein [Myxococcota bacterium]
MDHPVVSREEWLEARKALLAEEKAFTQQREAMAAKRRALPWVRVDEDYRFQGEAGERTLADLFAGRSQLLLQHFMFGPAWEAGCPSCSYWADQIDRGRLYLGARDIAYVAVSRAPLDTLLAYRARMGWSFPWVSSLGSSFNFDYRVSFTPEQRESGKKLYNYGSQPFGGEEAPGVSAFVREGDAIFHTYSTFARGLDLLNGAYHWMDIAPKGRDEAGLPFAQAWVKRRDEY